MSLASTRPRSLNEVVAQDRVIALLKALLTTGKFLHKGFLLKGPVGLGKTSTSYLFARALMCSGGEPLGCSKCPSCQLIDKEGIERHPDFFEIDAASTPGVQEARDLLERTLQPPIVGKRRVTVIDECHRLSGSAWDVFLKPLDQSDTDSMFLFATTDDQSVPYTIQSRAIPLTFYRASEDTLVGLLASLSSRNGITYELPALRDIAKHSKGIIRDAVKWLDMAASVGNVTKGNVGLILDTPLGDNCMAILMAITMGDQQLAAKLADDAGLMALPTKVIETLFAVYAKSPWAEPGSDLAKVSACLPVKDTSGVFLKWLGVKVLPIDALPLFVFELLGVAKAPRALVAHAGIEAPKKSAASIKAFLQREVI